MDVKYFYLNNLMDRAGYIMIQILRIPQEFIIAYDIKEKVHNGYISARLTKNMYVIPQAGKLASEP